MTLTIAQGNPYSSIVHSTEMFFICWIKNLPIEMEGRWIEASPQRWQRGKTEKEVTVSRRISEDSSGSTLRSSNVAVTELHLNDVSRIFLRYMHRTHGWTSTFTDKSLDPKQFLVWHITCLPRVSFSFNKASNPFSTTSSSDILRLIKSSRPEILPDATAAMTSGWSFS